MWPRRCRGEGVAIPMGIGTPGHTCACGVTVPPPLFAGEVSFWGLEWRVEALPKMAASAFVQRLYMLLMVSDCMKGPRQGVLKAEKQHDCIYVLGTFVPGHNVVEAAAGAGRR